MRVPPTNARARSRTAGGPGSIALLLVLLIVPLLARAEAAGQEAGGLFFDTVDVRVANIEVIVTDKEGRPVSDLTAGDFEVLEDGEPVELTNFFAVENRGVKGAGEEAATSSELLFYSPETRRLNLVLLVDDLNMRPENRNAVFDEVERFLRERLDPRDRVMVVSLGRQLEVTQPFSNDPGLLLRTIGDLARQSGDFLRFDTERRMLLRRVQTASLPPNPFRAAGGGPPDASNWEAAQQHADRLARDAERHAEVRMQQVRATVQALGEFTDSLAGMKGRKAVLYVSDGLPLRPADALAQAWLNKFADWIQTEGAQEARLALHDMTSLIGSSRFDNSSHFDRLVDRASANGVVFYPLSNASTLSRSAVSAEFQASGTSTGRGAYSQDVVALETLSLEGSLLRMADGTGGVAYTRTPNVSGLLDEVARDFDTFYSLGYSPRGDDQEIHEIEVRVKRKDLVVRHVGAHRLRDPVEHLQDLTLSALQFGLEDNTLEVELDPGAAVPAEGKRYQLPVMIKVPFRNVLLLPVDENHVGQLTLVVTVRDEGSGGVSEPQRIDVPLEVPNERMGDIFQQYAAYPLQLQLRQGRKRIAVGVRDELGRVNATVNLEIDVRASARDDESTTGD